MDLQFPGDVPAMGDDRIGGDAQMVGNLLIRHPLYQGYDHLLLTVAEGIRTLGSTALEHHVGYVLRHPILLGALFQTTDGRHKDMILDLSVLTEPRLIVIDIMECRRQLVVVQPVLRQVFDDEELQFAQLLIRCPMVLGEGLHIIVTGRAPLQQGLHIREERLLFVHHMTTYLMRVLIIETHDQLSERVVRVQRLREFTTDKRQLEVKEISMAGLQVMQQGRYGKHLVGLELTITVDGIVDDSQEGIGIHLIILTSLLYGLVTEAQADAKATQ